MASAGDVNGDGFADLIIGARDGEGAGNATSNAGESYVVFGKSSGWGAAIDRGAIAGGTGGFVINGRDAFDGSGRSVASAGDINGDGFDDLIIGAPYGDGTGANDRGESYVIFGRDFTSTVTHAGTVNDDLLTGDANDDVMVGGLGNDTLDGVGGADALEGGAGNDLIQVADLNFRNVDGGSGTDTLALTGSGQTLNLASIADTKLQSIEAIDLGAGGNTLRLTALEVLNLSDTTNTLRVTGGAGAVLTFDDAENWVEGPTADGFTTFTNGEAIVIAAASFFGPTEGNDVLSGTAGADTIDALGGDDTVFGDAGDDTLLGNAGNDTLDGGGGNDSLFGGNDADILLGGANDDVLSGDAGNDSLVGGEGDDTLAGGLGADTMDGGAGDDLLDFGDGIGWTPGAEIISGFRTCTNAYSCPPATVQVAQGKGVAGRT
ncbi:MAG: calcium-binding protein [Pseudomonadota bacterium]